MTLHGYMDHPSFDVSGGIGPLPSESQYDAKLVIADTDGAGGANEFWFSDSTDVPVP